jgi:hypothetical protein
MIDFKGFLIESEFQKYYKNDKIKYTHFIRCINKGKEYELLNLRFDNLLILVSFSLPVKSTQSEPL